MQILFNKWSEVNKKVCIFVYWGYGHMTLETILIKEARVQLSLALKRPPLLSGQIFQMYSVDSKILLNCPPSRKANPLTKPLFQCRWSKKGRLLSQEKTTHILQVIQWLTNKLYRKVVLSTYDHFSGNSHCNNCILGICERPYCHCHGNTMNVKH